MSQRAKVTVNGCEVGAELRNHVIMVFPPDVVLPENLTRFATSTWIDGTGTKTVLLSAFDLHHFNLDTRI